MTQAPLLEAALWRLPRHRWECSGGLLRAARDGLDELLQARDEAVAIARRQALQHRIEGLDLHPFEFLDEGLPLSSQLQDGHTPVSGVAAAREKPLLYETVDDLGDSWQRDLKRFRDLAHMAAEMLSNIEQHLRLGVGQFEFSRIAPQNLAEGRTQQGIQQLQQPLGFRRSKRA